METHLDIPSSAVFCLSIRTENTYSSECISWSAPRPANVEQCIGDISRGSRSRDLVVVYQVSIDEMESATGL